MFSKKLIIVLAFLALFLSITSLLLNMPAKKDKALMQAINPYLPFKITKTLGGLDIINNGKRMHLENAKVYTTYDKLLKKWGKKHLFLQGSTLIIVNDSNKTLKSIKLNPKQVAFVHRFFQK